MKIAPFTRAASCAFLALLAFTTTQSASAAGANDRTYIATVAPGTAAPNVSVPYVFTFTNYSKDLCQTCTPLHFIQQVQITVPDGFTLVTPAGASSPVTSLPSNWMVQSISTGSPRVITLVTISSTDSSFVVGKSINITVNAKYTGSNSSGCAAAQTFTWKTYANQSVSGGVGNAFALKSGSTDPKVTIASSDCLTGTNLALGLVTSNGNQTIKATDTNATVTLTATLTSAKDGSPISGEPIVFTLGGGTLACNPVTNASGVATCAFLPQQAPYTPLLAGIYDAQATFAGDAVPTPDWGSSASLLEQLTVNADGTGISVSDATGVYGGTVTLSATLTGSGNVLVPGRSINFYLNNSLVGSATTNASGVATLSNVSIAGINAGPQPEFIKAIFPGDGTYATVTGFGNLNVTQQSVTVLWSNPSDITYGTALSATQLNATVSPSIAGSFVYTPAAATVLNAGQQQTLSVVFNPTDTTNYGQATGSVKINVLQANQTISFGPLSDKTFGNTDFSLTATATSGLVVYFASTTQSVCTVSGSTLHIVAAGACSITATQPGNNNYTAATPVVAGFTVNNATMPALTLVSSTPLTYLQSETLSVTGGVPGGSVTYELTNGGPCGLSGAQLTAQSGAGACALKATMTAANYNAQTATATVYLTPAAQTITFGALSSKNYNDPDFGVSATATSGLTVAFSSSTTDVCTVTGTTVHLVMSGSCTIVASQSGNTNYLAATNVPQTFTVRGPQTITITSFTVTAKASSGLTPAFASVDPTVCTLAPATLNAADQTWSAVATVLSGKSWADCKITVDQIGNSDYTPAPQVTAVLGKSQ